jgi:hypothetical protein
MALPYGAKITTIDFSKMSGGINSTDPPTDIGKNQVQSALNAVFSNTGFSKCYGLAGLKNSVTFATTRGYGLHIYEKSDGTEILLAVSGQKLYSINETTGAATELYDFGSAGEAWFANYLGVCFVCNGTKMVKYDGTNAYQVGIAAPTAGNAAKAAGGSLAEGVYQLYWGYARKVSGSVVLYGSGYSLGSVTLSAGDLSIAITSMANSADPQVNDKVVWATDAAGGTFYFYAETGNNTTTSLTITDTSTRDSTRQYDVLAAYNFVPSSPQYLFVANNRLWYTSGMNAYFSLQAGTVYDLEKFDTGADGNILVFPHTLSGGFELGTSIYFNTTSGIICIPGGDISQKYEMRGAPYYFKYFRTMGIWNDIAIGLTQDGVLIFDGVKFNSIDISRDIKNEISYCYSSAATAFVPCGKVFRNKISGRTEYILSFVDSRINGNINNRQWVLDLDSLKLVSADDYNTQWEQWQHGFQYIAVKKDGAVYALQSIAEASNVILFATDTTGDKWIYNDQAAFVSSATNRTLTIKTAERIPDLLGFCRWMYVHMYALSKYNITVTVYIGEETTRKAAKTFVREETEKALFDEALFDEAVFDYETSVRRKLPLNKKMKGYSVYMVIEQSSDDTILICNRVLLTGTIKRSRKS